MTTNRNNISALILDMDGVIWRGDQSIGNLPEIFHRIKEMGLQVSLVTNNATLTIDQYLAKLLGFGAQLSASQIINSPIAAKQYLSKKYPLGGAVYIIGESGLIQALDEAGFHQSEKDVLAVVVGMDRELTYEKMCRATLLIRKGAEFVGTNADRTFPTPEGLVPGVGSILKALETATDSSPHVVGKPAHDLYLYAMERMGVKVTETLVVGDRLETDIQGAQELGCRTALVLSGVTDLENAMKWKPTPDFIAADLMTLLTQLD